MKSNLALKRSPLVVASAQKQAVLALPTTHKRQACSAKNTVVEQVMGLARSWGKTPTAVVDCLLDLHRNGVELPVVFAQAIEQLGGFPSRATLLSWVAKVKAGGDLTPQHKGSKRVEGGWEALAIEIYNKPSKPTKAAVFRYLEEIEGFDLSYHQLVRYLNALPASLGEKSPQRLGVNLHKLKEKAYRVRSRADVAAGEIYAADGYRADVYVAHPLTGAVWRPELTVAMDVATGCIVGWSVDEHEGTTAVQSLWAKVFSEHNHVPVLVYVDNGSGHKNKLMSAEVTGFYERAGCEAMYALPGNPHGKGWIERFFRTLKEHFLATHFPRAFCGTEMSQEARARMCKKTSELPTISEFSQALARWVEVYNSRPASNNPDISRHLAFSVRDNCPPVLSFTELCRQQVALTVLRGQVTHQRRQYRHADLIQWNHKKVVLEFDLRDDAVAVTRTPDGRFICDAHLVSSVPIVAANRMEEKQQRRLLGQNKRLEIKAEEVKKRAGRLIDSTATAVDELHLLEFYPQQPEAQHIVLDLTLSDEGEKA